MGSYLPGTDGRSRYDVNRTRVSIFWVTPVRGLAAGGKEDPDPSNSQILFSPPPRREPKAT